MQRLRIPSAQAVINAAALSDLVGEMNEANLASIGTSGIVGYSARNPGNIITPPVAATNVTISSAPFATLTTAKSSCRVYRSGKILGLNSNDRTLGDYLSRRKWPYTTGGGVSVQNGTDVTPVSTQTIYRASGSVSSGQTISFPANQFTSIRSGSSLRLLWPVMGTVSWSAKLFAGDEEVAAGALTPGSSTWSLIEAELAVTRRIRTGESLRLDLTAGSAGSVTRLAPCLYPIRNDFHHSSFLLPTGEVLMRTEPGLTHIGGIPYRMPSPATLVSDLSEGRIHVWVEPMATWSMRRVTSAGLSHLPAEPIESDQTLQVRYGPELPAHDHEEIALIEAG